MLPDYEQNVPSSLEQNSYTISEELTSFIKDLED